MSTERSSPHSVAAQRKGMRKGTHSCFECRKRKIRCIFRPGEPNICVSCNSRGSNCIEQRRELIPSAAEKNKSNLKERVAKLEAIIAASGLSAQDVPANHGATGPAYNNHHQILKLEEANVLATDSSADKHTPLSSAHHSDSLSINADSPQETDPIATLFNNAFWRRKSPDRESGADAIGSSLTGLPVDNADPKALAKRIATREALLSVLHTPELLGEILNATCSWWNTWKPLGPWQRDTISEEKPKSLQEFVLWALSSDNPATVGLAILSIAASIQQLDGNLHRNIILRLPCPPGKLFHQYFDLVYGLIISDSEFACSMEGIEVILMAAKLFMNFGLLKKSWVLNHQAGSYGQLLGLHRPQRLSRNESDEARARRHRSWLSICQGDVLPSLLLGLPYYDYGRTVSAAVRGEKGTTPSFHSQLMAICARVIDKSQMGLSLSLQLTQEIQKDLDSLAGEMDKDFWDVKETVSQGKITQEDSFDRIAGQLFYHLVRLYLHMPLMIQSIEDPRLGTHREMCLEACRDTLRTYHIMRSDGRSTFSMIKVIDYVAFICSALLLLGIMGYGSAQFLYHNNDTDRDRDLVSLTLDTLREASTSSGNTIASQAVQGLETLTSLASGNLCHKGAGEDQNPCAQIVVPYSGTITISAGSFFTGKKLASSHLAPNQAPFFSLLPTNSQTSAHQSQTAIPRNMQQNSIDSFDFNDNGNVGNLIIPEYPSIDFEWGNMVNMNTGEDWAWLMDVNNSNLNSFV